MNEWISVKDRLPEYGQVVIDCRTLSERFLCSVVEWDEEQERYMDLNQITHWMPLPEPPKQ